MAVGNEFSDHLFEKKNYLNLAGSKLRNCSLGPELVIDADFQSVEGRVSIERGREIIWSKAVRTGEAEMCHSLANIEHHHFKFEGHRRAEDVHVHFFGAVAKLWRWRSVAGWRFNEGAICGVRKGAENMVQVRAAATEPIAVTAFK